MTCGEVEILLAEHLDGALPAAEAQSVEAHLAGCAACSDLARDARLAMAFMERSSDVDAPPELLTRILSETASGRHGSLRARGIQSWFGSALAFLLQPRLVMGMALTMVSFSMMAKCAGVSPRQLRPADMDPKMIWASLDDRAMRAWTRTVKFYDDIKFVYEIQSSLREWTEQQEDEDRNAAAQRPVEERRVPANRAVQSRDREKP